MISIKDVAHESGLSIATVSRALRGLPGVSDATRERAREVADRLGYVASNTAASLASGQTHTVALVVPYVTRWFFGAVILGAEEVLRERGYDLLLFNLGGNEDTRRRVLQTHLLSRRVDAIVVLGLTPTAEEQEWLERNAPPVALVGSTIPGWPGVRIDDELAARTAVDHLLDLGHRRIGYVGGALEDPLHFSTPRARLSGYRHALSAAGVTPDPDLEDRGDFTVVGGVEAASRLLDLPEPPTAILCASDEMALGVLRTARVRGLRVPGDLSLVGIDDHEYAALVDLTTVRQPVHEQGRTAVLQVLAEVERRHPLPVGRPAVPSEPGPPQHVVLPTELVLRHSTARLGAPVGRSGAGLA